MIHRRLAFFVTLLAMVHGREARADECGDSPEIVAQDIEISPHSIGDCVSVIVGGTSRPGCEDLGISLENHCAFPITVVLDPSADCTELELWGEESCLQIPPDKGDNIYFPDVSTGPMKYVYPIIIQDRTVILTVTANLVDISGCSVSAVGSGGTSRAWMGLGGFGLAIAALRRRQRRAAS
ncbi:Hypothetical protein A7982_06181 [Minicystis rosea]|nr:Hypothetical protein A7982_06181 [Minicystis rosea]